ncbi:MAG: endonuclease III [Spirochaetaceae bacterium]|jgi:endonuclease-3|nr:endonuclease III [Spirochaetaceae bacterium]
MCTGNTQNKLDWDAVIAVLKEWKARQNAPSVTTIAERFKHDAWAVLSSTIISLRTKDEVTLVSSAKLLEKAPSPEKLLELDAAQIEKLIYPAGFYKTKTKNLISIAKTLVSAYKGKVPALMEELLALPGVGRKTANLVLIEAFDIDGICVDTHVHRISNRAGWLCSKTPEETETCLRSILPLRYWKEINPLLVLYGQQICRPISPFCSVCKLRPHCAQNGVGKTR